MYKQNTFALIVSCALFSWAPASAADGKEVESEMLSQEGLDIPAVLTATRINQSIFDSPASVTVITSEQIARYGIRSIVEAMRLVPGMELSVGNGSNYFIGNTFQVSYHGTNGLDPRRMNVMVDGVSMYQASFSEMKWDSLPVSIDDVDKIEVIRGSDSASYGPNSMMGVVNIITKSADQTRGISSGFENESSLQRRIAGHYSGIIGRTSFRLSAENIAYRGFSGNNGPYIPYSTEGETSHVTLNTSTAKEGGSEYALNAAYWTSHNGTSHVDPQQYTPAPANEHSAYISAKASYDLSETNRLTLSGYITEVVIKQRWRTAYPIVTLLPEAFALYQLNPQAVDNILLGRSYTINSIQEQQLAIQLEAAIHSLGTNAFRLIDAETDQDSKERRLELEAQDVVVIGDSTRTVWAVGVRANEGSSETFFGGNVSNFIWWALDNTEYKPTEKITLNLGAYFERGSLTGAVFTPRVGINWKPTEDQSIRVVFSEGARTPDLHEQHSYWTYRADWANDPNYVGSRLFESGISKNKLLAERLKSFEIGYYFVNSSHGINGDAKIFKESLTRLISEQLSIGKFTPTNSGSVELSGFEMELHASPSPLFGLDGTYTFLLNGAQPGDLERSQYAKNTVAAGGHLRLSDNSEFTLLYSRQTSEVSGMSPFGELDIGVNHTERVRGSVIRLRAGVTRFDLQRISTTSYGTIPSNAQSSVPTVNAVSYFLPSRFSLSVKAGIDF